MELVPLGPEFGVEVRGIGLIDVAGTEDHGEPKNAAAAIDLAETHAMDSGDSLCGRHRYQLS
jgi:hypothetical protein